MLAPALGPEELAVDLGDEVVALEASHVVEIARREREGLLASVAEPRDRPLASERREVGDLPVELVATLRDGEARIVGEGPLDVLVDEPVPALRRPLPAAQHDERREQENGSRHEEAYFFPRSACSAACFWIASMIPCTAAPMNVSRFSPAHSRLARRASFAPWKRGIT